MSKFIKLTNQIINSYYIQGIKKEGDNYHIQIMSPKIFGFSLFSIGGYMNSYDTQIVISMKKNPNDYIILTKWIEDCDQS